MSALPLWGATALAASTGFMLLALALRAPVRRWIGPRLAVALWALPALRLVLPPLPAGDAPALPLAGRIIAFAVGTPGAATANGAAAAVSAATIVLAIWATGAIALLAIEARRHLAFCAALRRDGTALGEVDGIRILAADVDGPLAFGVLRRRIAVPRGFMTSYDARERALALAHERAHHARGDLLANWIALAVLAVHWWNPVAWIAIRAFRDDQEFAADATVLGRAGPAALPAYATLLAKAAGIGAPPACNLTLRAGLKGRLKMLDHKPRPRHRTALGAALLALLGGTALAASATAPVAPTADTQAVTIAVKPDGTGAYTLIVHGAASAPGAPLPKGLTLPADFDKAGGCDLTPAAKPVAMAIKGGGTIASYTVICATAAPATVHATLDEGLASLRTMRAAVATQPASAAFPESERTYALGVIDRSIREVSGVLGRAG